MLLSTSVSAGEGPDPTRAANSETEWWQSRVAQELRDHRSSPGKMRRRPIVVRILQREKQSAPMIRQPIVVRPFVLSVHICIPWFASR
ncbi:hypothetical protein CH275_24050 [Rhodococcus sp. 06-235-1A]|nr:hypothetical protein CH275_24050 [Rhodococcus sp. 06-235-1A]